MFKLNMKNKLLLPYSKLFNFKAALRTFATKESIEDLLKKSISFESLLVEDTSGNCGQAFKIKIKSKEFNGKGLVQQHRMITDILKSELKDVHSINLKTEECKK